MNEFTTLRIFAGFESREKIAEFCGVTVKTIMNWERNGAPLVVIRLLKFIGNDLSCFGENWKGCKIDENAIYVSKKDFIYPCEIKWIKNIYESARICRHSYIERNSKNSC